MVFGFSVILVRITAVAVLAQVKVVAEFALPSSTHDIFAAANTARNEVNEASLY